MEPAALESDLKEVYPFPYKRETFPPLRRQK